ncbi:MAG: sugar phosphate isomerase/epimerase family protein [Thermoguttaceae bacterium]
MEPKAYCHLWAYPITSPATFRTIRESGYAGIESGLGFISDPDSFRSGLKQFGLEFIGQVHTGGFTKGHSVAEHLSSLEAGVRKLLPLEPVLINIHSGEDTWPLDAMHQYFRGAEQLEKTFSVPFAHETHRGRCLFHPAVARILIDEHPEIKVIADLSHWVCVCERLLGDQAETLARLAERTVYVHCRVGYAEGPQVSDPRWEHVAPEREAFESWWRMIFHAMGRRGLSFFSFCPEYGPAPYMPLLPFTGMPVADLEGICQWQVERIGQLVRQWQT